MTLTQQQHVEIVTRDALPQIDSAGYPLVEPLDYADVIDLVCAERDQDGR